jgi:hypothetical protein
LVHLGSIAGNVSEDTNNDDEGDSRLSGVTITLYDGDGTVVSTTLTDELGNYIFTELPFGDYVVAETNLQGFFDVKDKDGGVDANLIYVIIGGNEPANSLGNDFVDERFRTIAGNVTEDINNDDTGDKAIPGVMIELRDSSNALVLRTSTTDSEGHFIFEEVPPDTYTLKEINPAGVVDVVDSDGGDPNVISVDVTTNDSLNNEFVDELPNSSPSISGVPSSAPSAEPSGSSMPSDAPSILTAVSSLGSADNLMDRGTSGAGGESRELFDDRQLQSSVRVNRILA